MADDLPVVKEDLTVEEDLAEDDFMLLGDTLAVIGMRLVSVKVIRPLVCTAVSR